MSRLDEIKALLNKIESVIDRMEALEKTLLFLSCEVRRRALAEESE